MQRNGIFFRDLNEERVAVAFKIARLALSDDGFTRFQEVRRTPPLLAPRTKPNAAPPVVEMAVRA